MPPVSMEDLEIEELLKRYKKRDLVQTYFFKMACRVFGPPKSRDRIIIAPPMHVVNKAQREPVEGLRRITPASRKNRNTAVMSTDSPAQPFTSFPAENTASQEWVGERRAFRKMLNGVGNVSRWINNKPTVTELELKVAEREASVRRGRSSVRSEPHLSPAPKSSLPIICETPTLHARDPGEVRKQLRGRETLILEVCSQLDTRGTGRLTRRDLRALFEKTGMKVSEERLEALMASLGCDGGCVTVAELAAGIQSWTEGGSRDEEGGQALAHLHTLTHTLLQEREECDRIRIYHQQRRKGGVLLDEEDVIM
ncbi:EF-hand calcium-binding domain-containing protein 12 [Sardina pilchardus]|uniref:EF-hand calcium-binding domain-containing protein 12 n=1 Tax=Sardina pilchardus TaxID=27697 RepID=UPI002E0FEA44